MTKTSRLAPGINLRMRGAIYRIAMARSLEWAVGGKTIWFGRHDHDFPDATVRSFIVGPFAFTKFRLETSHDR